MILSAAVSKMISFLYFHKSNLFLIRYSLVPVYMLPSNYVLFVLIYVLGLFVLIDMLSIVRKHVKKGLVI